MGSMFFSRLFRAKWHICSDYSKGLVIQQIEFSQYLILSFLKKTY